MQVQIQHLSILRTTQQKQEAVVQSMLVEQQLSIMRHLAQMKQELAVVLFQQAIQ